MGRARRVAGTIRVRLMMGTVREIPVLDAKGLRDFGLVNGAVAAALFGLLLPWIFGFDYPRWPWYLFAVLSVWALTLPNLLRPVYWAWMKLGLIISRITTPLILGIVFFVVIMPIGLIRRVFGKDSMSRGFDTNASSYRIDSPTVLRKNLENPY